MEQCEKYKSLQPQFSLHLGELFEYLKKEKSKTFSKTSNISSKGSIIT